MSPVSAFGKAFVRYHRGLGRMPVSWKPWLLSLLAANMIVPLFYLHVSLEAWVIFGVALLNGATFVVLTALTGFSRLLGLGHIFWIPLVVWLWGRLEAFPGSSLFACWLWAVVILDTGSVVLDAANVVRFIRGDRAEMVEGL